MAFILSLCVANIIHAQRHISGYNENIINPDLLEKPWAARWISYPGASNNDYGIYHFRKSFNLKEIPSSMIIHVSADNRYKLFVNGNLASLGPARGDVYNWNFETVDISKFLCKGKNVLAAVVWNYGDKKPVAQMSLNKTGFILQGNSERDTIINTDNRWLCLENKAYAPWTDWQVLGYYVAGPGEEIDMNAYPYGWEKTDYDDSKWEKAVTGREGAIKGARDYPERLLVPSPIPQMEMKKERFSSIRKSEGIECSDNIISGNWKLTIPENKSVKLLLDQGNLTTGYLSMNFSGGEDAEIIIKYAESLYNNDEQSTTKSYSLPSKGNRNEVEGKRFIGYEDKIIPDGGNERIFTPLWWRTWRYVELCITTKDQPLSINDIYSTFSAYPFRNETSFSAPGFEKLEKMLDIGWRTARLCANETYMDCPYYEQLQYFGDTRIQAMISLYNTRDSFMVKNAIEQGKQSMVAEGITMSRYPSYVHQFISSFSLWWICMGHDYWMMRGDENYMKTLLPAYRNVLAWYEQWLKPDYSLDYVPHWFFADWAKGFDYGEPIREKDGGNSAFQDLMYIMALDAVSEMEQAIGIKAMGEHYSGIAQKIRDSFRNKYWVEERSLFADTYSKNSFSQHVNALAIIAGLTNGNEAKEVMKKTLSDSSLIQTTIYFRYYLNLALEKSGLGDSLLDNLQIWENQMSLGLTTWAEMPEPSRSDCHAWGASPNIEFYRIILGIESAAPGFKKVRISPALGKLRNVSGSIPHPNGEISVSYNLDKGEAVISLPQQTSGTFIWKGKEYKLNSGKQVLKL